MISEEIKLALEDILEEMFNEVGLERPVGLKIVIDHTTDLQFGDYSTNVAMQLAKTLRRPPQSIAQELRGRLMNHERINTLFQQVEVDSPGFINLYLDWSQWASKSFSVPHVNNKKVLIEHTSINPNKSAHIGHLRNSCIGDTLAKMLKAIAS
jgi:arginyl-tRNA synthetase